MPYYYHSSILRYPERKKRPKLLVAGSFMVGGNAGDMAALIALRQYLERIELPIAVETLSSSSSEFANLEYLFELGEMNQPLVNYLIDDTKLLLILGGGIFFGTRTVEKLKPILNHKPTTALFAIGTDMPTNSRDEAAKSLLPTLLAHAVHLSTRSSFAHNICDTMGIRPTESNPLGDIVHLLDTMPSFYYLRKSGYFHVAVNLAGVWADEAFYKHIAQTLDALVEKNGKVKFFFLPFGYRIGQDTLAHQKVIGYLKHKECVTLIQKFIYPTHLQDILSQMDFLIGMRLHANIMAYNVQIPFAAINYHPKVKSFLDQIQLKENILLNGGEVVPPYYGYGAPTAYPSIEETLTIIEKAQSKTPPIKLPEQRKKIENKLNELITSYFHTLVLFLTPLFSYGITSF